MAEPAQSPSLHFIEAIPNSHLLFLNTMTNEKAMVSIDNLYIFENPADESFVLRQQPNFEYVLSPSLTVAKGTDKRYLFPTSQENVFFVLAFIPPEKDKIAMLDVILKDNARLKKAGFTQQVYDSGKQLLNSGVKTGSAWYASGKTYLTHKFSKTSDGTQTQPPPPPPPEQAQYPDLPPQPGYVEAPQGCNYPEHHLPPPPPPPAPQEEVKQEAPAPKKGFWEKSKAFGGSMYNKGKNYVNSKLDSGSKQEPQQSSQRQDAARQEVRQRQNQNRGGQNDMAKKGLIAGAVASATVAAGALIGQRDAERLGNGLTSIATSPITAAVAGTCLSIGKSLATEALNLLSSEQIATLRQEMLTQAVKAFK